MQLAGRRCGSRPQRRQQPINVDKRQCFQLILLEMEKSCKQKISQCAGEALRAGKDAAGTQSQVCSF